MFIIVCRTIAEKGRRKMDDLLKKTTDEICKAVDQYNTGLITSTEMLVKIGYFFDSKLNAAIFEKVQSEKADEEELNTPF